MPAMIRTFVAIDLAERVGRRAGQLIERLRPSGAKVKWVDPEHLHLTIKFLGDVPTLETPAVCRAVIDCVAGRSAFEIALAGVGAFPSRQRPRVVWLGVVGGRAQLGALHEALDESLRPLGYRGDSRPFAPHLTLGRVREGGPSASRLRELLDQERDFAAGTSPVGELLVMASHLDSAGPRYEVMSRAPLLG